MPRLDFPGPLRIVVIILLIAAIATAQRPTEISNHLAVLHCDESRSTLAPSRVALALQYAAEEMRVPVTELPHIVIIRCTVAVADVAYASIGDNGGGVMAIAVSPTKRMYDLWVVGDDVDLAMVRGLVTILALDRSLDVAKQDVHVRRVMSRLTASVSAETFQVGSNRRLR